MDRSTRLSGRMPSFEYLRHLTADEQIAWVWAAFARGEIDEAAAGGLDAQLRRRQRSRFPRVRRSGPQKAPTPQTAPR